MFTKLMIVAATAVVIAARPQDHHAGHAYSSQSILLHAGGDNHAVNDYHLHDAGNHGKHGQHGHAYSSQSIVVHHAEPHHVEQHYGHDLQAARDNHGHAYSSQNIVLSHGDDHNSGSLQNVHSDGHHQAGHGHAYSSQNIVLHHAHNVPVVHNQNAGHHQNVIIQNAHEAVHFVPTVTVQHHDDGHHYGHASSAQHLLVHQGHEAKHVIEHYAHPKYEFVYKVADPHTGDFKSHHESRDGDVVKGVYSLHEADGTTRIVEYHADKHSGFNAVVKREGHSKHIVASHNYHH